MELNTRGFLKLVDTIAPFSLSESWDNSGLQAGNPEWPVRKVLVALDATMDALKAAKEQRADLVLTHHPLMMRPPASMDFSCMPGEAVAFCASNRISLVAAHTNVDKADPGLNDFFAARIGLGSIAPMMPGSTDKEGDTSPGFGRVGQLDGPLTLKAFADRLKMSLSAPYVRFVGNPDLVVSRVAVCTGSGGSLVHDFFRTGAQVFVTGDIKYHEARDVEVAGRGLIDVGHFASEVLVVDFFREVLVQAASTQGYLVDILKFNREKDPFISI